MPALRQRLLQVLVQLLAEEGCEGSHELHTIKA